MEGEEMTRAADIAVFITCLLLGLAGGLLP